MPTGFLDAPGFSQQQHAAGIHFSEYTTTIFLSESCLERQGKRIAVELNSRINF
jgi:hypothetical protein